MLKVCLGTYKGYNEGNYGEWIDISDFKDVTELQNYIKKKFKESDPEYMVQDAEAFTDTLGESPKLEDLFTLDELMNEYGEDSIDALQDAVEIGGIENASETMENLIGDSETMTEVIYEDACSRLETVEGDSNKQFFQDLIDRYDWRDDVPIWEANGAVYSGSHGNYFWR